jgi:hypothetical protein
LRMKRSLSQPIDQFLEPNHHRRSVFRTA